MLYAVFALLVAPSPCAMSSIFMALSASAATVILSLICPVFPILASTLLAIKYSIFIEMWATRKIQPRAPSGPSRASSNRPSLGGKRAIAAEVSDETPAPKRRWPAAVTPSVSSLRLSLSTPLPPDSINTRDLGGVFSPSNLGAMLINQRDSVVPHHAAHQSSVLQRVYKRLPLHDAGNIF